MAYINYIEYEDASPELRVLYEELGAPEKTPANIIRIAGYNPTVMEAHSYFYRSIMFGRSPLSRAQREMIGVVVSAVNNCHY
ncbi:MAG: carboxymuconolactone decarboxylase family protein [candidate division Zixibacteria bacterium]|nr:carboxymuconolactone decarboxylase family protein [candidate division Zixibacteria bacterium]